MMLTFDDTCAWIGGAWPQLAHLSEPCQRRAGQHDIADRLGDRDEQQKAPERFTQHSGDDGERIANERHPAQKQAPATIAMIPGRCTVERGRACRKPGTVAETLDSATEQPIHQRTEDIADARDRYQQCGRMLARYKKRSQRSLGLAGKIVAAAKDMANKPPSRARSFMRQPLGASRSQVAGEEPFSGCPSSRAGCPVPSVSDMRLSHAPGSDMPCLPASQCRCPWPE